EFTTDGLVNGDSVASVTLTSDGAAATAGVAGSPYAIVPSAAQGSGLDNYKIGYTNGTLKVTPAPLTITANDQTKVYGDANPTLDGTIVGLKNGDAITASYTTGADQSSAVGNHDIVPAAVDSDPSTLGNYDVKLVDGTLKVTPAPLTITANDQTKVYGATFTFSGTEFKTDGLVNGDSVHSVTLKSDGAAATAGVAGSPYAIVPSKAQGSGLGNYSIGYVNGTLTVVQAQTITALKSSVNPSACGQSVTFTATVLPAAASGTVTFKDGATVLGTVTISNGVATLTTSKLAVGSHAITAVYSGDGNYAGSTSVTLNQVVKKATKTTLLSCPNPSSYGQCVTFTAMVCPSGATGTVAFYDGSTLLGTAKLGCGSAWLTTSALAVGTHTISAVYSGDTTYATSTATLTQTVKKAATTTTLKSSANPSTSGQSVTFTAKVSPAGATGSVTFKDGSTVLGTATLAGGSATLTTSTLAVGSHTITAVYGGNTNCAGSTSATLTQVVKKKATK
ncbi:MAG: Ig-like domain repeat protein, partial [Thermoleophilia bacterium]